MLKKLTTLLLTALFAVNVNAQTTCNNATYISNGCYNNIPLESDTWYQFTADSSCLDISLMSHLTDTSSAYINKIYLYTNTCSNLLLIDSSSCDLIFDSIQSLKVCNLAIGQTYFLLVDIVPQLCTGCTSNTFDFCFQLFNIGNCSIAPPCDYVCNGNFEMYSPCPTSVSQLNFVTGWQNPCTACPFPISTPDYFNTCVSTSGLTVDVPLNQLGTQFPHSGNGYAGAYLYSNNNNNYREYIETKLVQKLDSGCYYRVAFWVSLSDKSKKATDKIGAYLSSNYIMQSAGNIPLPFTPQINNTPGNFITNKGGSLDTLWVLVVGTFQAQGGEEYLTIGNFYDDSNTSLVNVTGGTDDKVYYYIDDVSVSKVEYAIAMPDTICYGDSTKLMPTGCFNFYSWTSFPTDSSLLGQTHNPIPCVKPKVSTHYVVVSTDLKGCTSSDTVFVYVIPHPPAFASGPTYACVDDTVTYTVNNCTPNINLIYNWTTVFSTIIGSSSSCSLTVNLTNAQIVGDTIVVAVTDTRTGCTHRDTIFVQPCCTILTDECIYYTPGLDTIVVYIGQFTNYTNAQQLSTAFNSATFINFKFFVQGTFTVNIPQIDFTRCHFYMAPYSKIKINSARRMALDNCRFEAGCCEMWDGIYIADVTAQLIANVSYFEDAFNTIVSNNGGYFAVNKCGFNKNLRSIVINPYNNTHTGFVLGSEFTCASNAYNAVPDPILSPGNFLLPPYQTKRSNIAIDIINNKQIKIGNETQNQFKNTFNNHNIGIQSNGSNTTVVNALFTNINLAQGQSPRAAIFSTTNNIVNVGSLTVGGLNIPTVRTCEFKNCIVGVEINSLHNNSAIYNNRFNPNNAKAIFINGVNNTNAVINVQQNQIVNSNIAIHAFMNGGGTFNIVSNTIYAQAQMGPTGILMQEFSSINTGVFYNANGNQIDKVQYGIRAQNLYGANITSNTIVTKNGATQTSRGIEVLANQSTNVILNDIQHTSTTTSPSRGGIYASLSPQTYFYCNDIRYLGYALQCEGQMPSDIFNNTFRNCFRGFWLSNSGFVGVQDNPNIPGQASYNKWLNFGSNDRTYSSSGTNGALSPFVYRTGPSFYQPIPAGDDGIGFVVPIGFIATSTGPVGSPNCNPPPQFVLLKAAHQIANGQITFSQNNVLSQWNNNQNLFYNIFSHNINVSNDAVLNNFMNGCSSAALGQLAVLSQTISNSNSSVAALQTAQMQNNSIVCSNSIETNLQTVNTIFANYRLNGALSNSEIFTLQYIAQLCPFTDGIGVYSARTILTAFDSTEYINICEIDMSGNRITNEDITTVKSVKELAVYPNPSSGEITVEYTLAENDVAIFVVYDLVGKKLKSFKLNNEKTILNLNDLTSGVYLYSITINGELKEISRIVIVK